jgi:hypothetical protein
MSRSFARASQGSRPDGPGRARLREADGLNAIVSGEDGAIPEATVEAIAERVAARLAGHAREPVRLYDTRAVARMLAVSEDWVRDHAAELGAIRVGDSPRGPLRFDSNKLAAAIDRRRVGRPEPARRPRRPGPRRAAVWSCCRFRRKVRDAPVRGGPCGG